METPGYLSKQGVLFFTGEHAQLTQQPQGPKRTESISQGSESYHSQLIQHRNLDLWSPSCPLPLPQYFRQRFPVDYALIRVGKEASQVYWILVVLPSPAPNQGQPERPHGKHGNNQALFTMDASFSSLKTKTEFSRQRISYMPLDQWNDLSEAIKAPISLNAFKAKLLDHLRAAVIVFNILYIDFSL